MHLKDAIGTEQNVTL